MEPEEPKPYQQIFEYLQTQDVQGLPQDAESFKKYMRENEEMRNDVHGYLSGQGFEMPNVNDFALEFHDTLSIGEDGQLQRTRPESWTQSEERVGQVYDNLKEREPKWLPESKEEFQRIAKETPTVAGEIETEIHREEVLNGGLTRRQVEEVARITRDLPRNSSLRKLGALVVTEANGGTWKGKLAPSQPNPSIEMAYAMFSEGAALVDDYAATKRTFDDQRSQSLDEREFNDWLLRKDKKRIDEFLLPTEARMGEPGLKKIQFVTPDKPQEFQLIRTKSGSLADLMPDASPKERVQAYYNLLLDEYDRLSDAVEVDYRKVENTMTDRGGNQLRMGQASLVKDYRNADSISDYLNIAAGMYAGMSMGEKRQLEVVTQLVTLAPIVKAGIDPTEVLEADGTIGASFMGSFGFAGVDSHQLAAATMRALSGAGVSLDERDRLSLLEKQKMDWVDKTEQLIGISGAIATQMALTRGVSDPATKTVKGIKTFGNIQSKTKLGKFALNSLDDMIEAGVRYEVAGQLAPEGLMKDELTFTSGVFGGLGQAVFTPWVRPLMGKLNGSVGKFLTRRTGSGMGEMGEETFQEIWQTYTRNDGDFKKAKAEFEKQFGNVGDASFFFLSSFAMGFAMGGADVEIDPAKRKAMDEFVGMAAERARQDDPDGFKKVTQMIEEVSKETSAAENQEEVATPSEIPSDQTSLEEMPQPLQEEIPQAEEMLEGSSVPAAQEEESVSSETETESQEASSTPEITTEEELSEAIEDVSTGTPVAEMAREMQQYVDEYPSTEDIDLAYLALANPQKFRGMFPQYENALDQDIESAFSMMSEGKIPVEESAAQEESAVGEESNVDSGQPQTPPLINHNGKQYVVQDGRVYRVGKNRTPYKRAVPKSSSTHDQVIGLQKSQQETASNVADASANQEIGIEQQLSEENQDRVGQLVNAGLSEEDARTIVSEAFPEEGDATLSEKGAEIRKSQQIREALSQTKNRKIRVIADKIWRTKSGAQKEKDAKREKQQEERSKARAEVDLALNTSDEGSSVKIAKGIQEKIKKIGKKKPGRKKKGVRNQKVKKSLKTQVVNALHLQLEEGALAKGDPELVFEQVLEANGLLEDYNALAEDIEGKVTSSQAKAFGFKSKREFANAITSQYMMDPELLEKGRFTGADIDSQLEHFAVSQAKAMDRSGNTRDYSQYGPTPQKLTSAGAGSTPTRWDIIPVSPIVGQKPKQLLDSIRNLQKGLKLRLLFAMPKIRSRFGSYEYRPDLVKLRFTTDMNTLSHELGHVISSHFLVVPSANMAAQNEMMRLAATGSPVPPGHPNPAIYQLEEGFAEYMAAQLVNPAAAAAEFPAITSLYQSTVPASARDTITEFGTDIRTLLGATVTQRQEAMVMALPRTKKEARKATERGTGTAKQTVTKNTRARIGRLGFWGYMNVSLFDAMAPVFGAFDKMLVYQELGHKNALGKTIRDWSKITPGQDVLIRARTFLGFHGRIKAMFENGFEEAEGKIAVDKPTGEVISIPWTMGAYDNRDASTLHSEASQGSAIMIAQRVVEKFDGPVDLQGPPPSLPGDTTLGNDVFRVQGGRVYQLKRDGSLRSQPIPLGSDLHKVLTGGFGGKTIPASSALPGDIIIGGYAFRMGTDGRLYRIRNNGSAYTKPVPTTSNLHKFVVARQTGMDPDSVVSGAGMGYFRDIDEARRVIEEYTQLATTDPKKHTRLTEGIRRYRVAANVSLRYMLNQGRLSQSDYDKIVANNEQYVAMNRLMASDPDDHSFSVSSPGSSLVDGKNPIKKFKGSGRIILNPYLNLMNGSIRAYRETDRNSVIRSFVDMGRFNRSQYSPAVPPSVQGLVEDVTAAVNAEGQNAVSGISSQKNVVAVFHDGEKRYYRLDEEVYRAFSSMYDYGQSMPWMLRAWADVLKTTVTSAPTFAARNLMRDTLTRMGGVTATNGRIPILSDALEPALTVREILAQSNIDDFQRYGGSQGGYYNTDPGLYYLQMAETMTGGKTLGAKLNPKNWWQNYQDFLSRFENANRLREYQRAYDEATNVHEFGEHDAKLYAAFRARDLMDFAVGGEISLFLNKAIPFFNPWLRGMARTFQAARENPGRFMALVGAYIIAPAIAMRILAETMGVGDEYEQLPAYQRDLFYNIKSPDGSGFITIPKPHDIGMVGSGFDRAVGKVFFGEENAMDGYGKSIVQLIAKPEVLYGPAPPMVENMANYNFFRQKHIVPLHEEGRLLSTRKGKVSASVIGKGVSDAMSSFGIEALQWDPRKIDNFMLGSFGYLGDYVIRGTNTAFGSGKEFRDYDDFGDFVRRFSGVYKEDPYYTAKDVQWLMDYAQTHRLEREGPYETFKLLMSLHMDAPEEHKKESGKDMVKYAKDLRKTWSDIKYGETMSRIRTEINQAQGF